MKNRKNILILHTDQQRYDSLGCNGNPNARTKNIDALAEEGCRFTRHITANPTCMPSRASLLTGLHVPAHGVSSNGIPLWRRDNGCADKNSALSQRYFGTTVPDRIPTMADILGDRGYRTALLGKLHLQPHLADKSYGFWESYETWEEEKAEYRSAPYYGFQTSKIILGHGEAPCGYNRGHYGRQLLRNHPHEADLSRPGEDANTREQNLRSDIYLSKLPSRLHNTTWLADETCDYLENYARTDSEDSPLFMFVGFPDPHHPFTPPEDVAGEFLDLPLPDFADKRDIKGKKPDAVMKVIEQFRTDKKDIQDAWRYTAASVHLIDRAVGQITAKLKELDLYDDTLIVFTSDHGDFLGDLDMVCKFDNAFHNLLHVPFIVKPAGNRGLPAVMDRPMSNVDVLPTLLNLAGEAVPDHIQGVDILSKEAEDNTPMVTAYNAGHGSRNISLYDKHFRYTLYIDTGEEELYDHRTDEKELINLADNPAPENRRRCGEMKAELLQKHIESETGIYNHYGLW